MSDTISVAGLTGDNAVLLLAAAEELGLDASVVQTTSYGHFNVPAEVADKAGFDKDGNPKSKAAKEAAAAVEPEPETMADVEANPDPLTQVDQQSDNETDPGKPGQPRRRAAKKAASKPQGE